MKAKQVNEFEQGGNPYDTMGLGKYDHNYDFKNPEEGDHIILLEEVCSVWVKGSDIFTRDKLNDVLEIVTAYKAKTIFHYVGYEGWVELEIWIDNNEDIQEIIVPDEVLRHTWVLDHQKYFKKLKVNANK
jgi:hypothetical protein